MKIEEAKKILNENGYVLLDEVFGFSAEEMLEAGAEYEDVMAFGGLVE